MATDTISGTTNITDATLRSGSPTWNYGGNSNLGCYSSSSTRRNFVIKCDSSAIPAGTIDAIRLYLYQVGDTGATADIYRIADANTWVEGTLTGGSTKSGACCWDYAKYTTQAWAGSAGCETSGTDYDSSPSYNGTLTLNTMVNIALSTTWATNWRDTTSTNQGVLVRNPAAGASVMACTPSEGAANQPTWQIDYTASGGQPAGRRIQTIPFMSGARSGRGSW